jgi:hypothetical protein
MTTRRQFIASAAVAPLFQSARAQTPPQAGRKLDFQIADGFGKANKADIRAVLHAAADSIWQHCPNTHWEAAGFYIYHCEVNPICNYDHRDDGRIAVGLTSQGTLWARFAFQFAHEFCHALAGHANDWHKHWIKDRKANHWLEESLCETASLFALRAMGKTWQTAPPYPNWTAYAPALTHYARERLDQTVTELPSDASFSEWFRKNEAALRQNAVLREKNTVVAKRLLPLFEAAPAGWEAITFYNLGRREPDMSLSDRLSDWTAQAPPEQRAFIRRIAAIF